MPIGPELHDGIMESNADAATHAYDHGFALHDFLTGLEVVDDVLGYEIDTAVGPDDGFKLGPFGLSALFGVLLLAFGDFFELRIEDFFGDLGEFYFG